MIKKIILILILLAVAFGVYRLVNKEGALRLRDKVTFWDNDSTDPSNNTPDGAVQETTEEGVQENTIVLGEETGGAISTDAINRVSTGDTTLEGSLLDSVMNTIEEKENTWANTTTRTDTINTTGTDAINRISTVVPPTLGEDSDKTETSTSTNTNTITNNTSTDAINRVSTKTTSTKSVLHQLFK